MEISLNVFKRAYVWLSQLFVSQDTQRRNTDTYIPAGFNMRQPRKLNVALLRNLSKEPLARSAINQIIDGIQNLEYEVTSIDGNKHDAEIKLVKQILKNPNSRDDYYDFVAKIMDDILVLNMGCFEKKKTRGKQPLFLFPIDAETIKLVDEWDGNPNKPRFAQSYMGKDSYYTPQKVAMLQRNVVTYDDFAFSPIEIVYRQIQYLADVQDFSNEIASNGFPKFFVNIESASAQEINMVRDYVENSLRGNSTLGLFGTNGMTATQVSPIGDEPTCLGWQKMLIQIIATAFNIPSEKLGAAISNDRSTSSEKENDMLENTIKPWSRILERAINQHVIAQLGFEDKIQFNFLYSSTSAQKTNAVDRINKLVAGSIITIPEARKALDGVLPFDIDAKPDEQDLVDAYKGRIGGKSEVGNTDQTQNKVNDGINAPVERNNMDVAPKLKKGENTVGNPKTSQKNLS